MFQNFPNPFSSETTLRFYLPGETVANIYFFDAAGRRVDSIEGAIYPRGYNTLDFRARSGTFSPGVYFILLRAGGKEDAIKAMILK